MRIVKTTTEDGLNFTGFLSEPENKSCKIIIHIHGMAGSPYDNNWYQHFHQEYPTNGYAFLVGQNRGTGSITQFTHQNGTYPNYGNALEIFEESLFDIDAWVNYARQLGYQEIILQAHSFGPSKVIYYLSQKSAADITAAILISPVDMLGLTQAGENYQNMLTEADQLADSGKGTQLLSQLLDGDTYLSAQTFLNLFRPDSKANIFSYTDRPHDWTTVNGIKLPVLLIGGSKDQPMEIVCPTKKSFEILKDQFGKSARADFNTSETRSKSHFDSKIYKNAQHDFNGFEKQITQDVISFLNK